jgi:hypothetical protein
MHFRCYLSTRPSCDTCTVVCTRIYVPNKNPHDTAAALLYTQLSSAAAYRVKQSPMLNAVKQEPSHACVFLKQIRQTFEAGGCRRRRQHVKNFRTDAPPNAELSCRAECSMNVSR